MISFIEALHLLPQRFEIQTAYSSSRDVWWNSGTPPPKSLFGSFRKACRTSSRGRLFYFGAVARQSPRSSWDCGCASPTSEAFSVEKRYAKQPHWPPEWIDCRQEIRRRSKDVRNARKRHRPGPAPRRLGEVRVLHFHVTVLPLMPCASQ
jgi:hypothetical protein